MIEAERRWNLASNPPSESIISISFIEQMKTGENPRTRVRKETKIIDDENRETSFTHTTKYKINSFVKEEIETKISESQYQRIIDLYEKKDIISKKRTVIDIGGGLLAEVDEYLEKGNIIIEVEFPSEQASDNFIPPDWFGEEVKQKNNFLWK